MPTYLIANLVTFLLARHITILSIHHTSTSLA
jgi:hypothetical protein